MRQVLVAAPCCIAGHCSGKECQEFALVFAKVLVGFDDGQMRKFGTAEDRDISFFVPPIFVSNHVATVGI